MIISSIDKDNMFSLRWRENGERKSHEVPYSEFKPYFYILAGEKEMSHIFMTDFMAGKKTRFRVDLFYNIDGAVSLEGEALKKVTWSPPKPGYTRTIRKEWEKTFEADVPFHYRYSIDCLDSIPEYNLRKWYWDLEWQQGGKYDGAITCISLYDSFLESYIIMWWSPTIETWFDGKPHGVYELYFESEKEMLESFLEKIGRRDPDMLISWFGSKFDIPKLLERLVANNLDPRELSPHKDVKGVYFSDGIKLSKYVKKYSPIEQPIRGRIVLNLDLAFERQWNDAQRGTLPSLALDYIAETVLGEKKLVSERFPDKMSSLQGHG